MTSSHTSFYELVYDRVLSPATTDITPTKDQLEAAIKVLNEKIEELKKSEAVVFKEGSIHYRDITYARDVSCLHRYYYKDGKYYDIDRTYPARGYEVDFDTIKTLKFRYSMHTNNGLLHVVEDEDKELMLVFVIRA